jgi:hypoxanthine phosphoribosyltransferase
MSPKKFKHLSWEDIEKSCLSIYSQIKSDHYKPECIVGLLRGGIVPARIFSDFFHIFIDFFALDVKLYQKIGIRRSKPVVKSFSGDVRGRRILIIDDIWDSGMTMNAVQDYLKDEDIKTATLYWKETSPEKPDYYAEVAKIDEWIVFPWERYEFWKEINEEVEE